MDIPPRGPYTPEQLAEIHKWIDATEMCNHCCKRVPKAEVEQGLHLHPAVMDSFVAPEGAFVAPILGVNFVEPWAIVVDD